MTQSLYLCAFVGSAWIFVGGAYEYVSHRVWRARQHRLDRAQVLRDKMSRAYVSAKMALPAVVGLWSASLLGLLLGASHDSVRLCETTAVVVTLWTWLCGLVSINLRGQVSRAEEARRAEADG